MICYFQEGLKSFIKVEMEQQDWESMDFEEIIQRTVNVEAKVGLRSSIMVRDSDACCPRGYRLSHNTSSKVQTQGSKDSSCSKKPKLKDPKPASSRDNAAELAKKENRKDKKKRPWNQRQKEQPPATDTNNEAPKKKKRGVIPVRSCISTAIRKTITPTTASSLQKMSVGLGNLRAGDQ